MTHEKTRWASFTMTATAPLLEIVSDSEGVRVYRLWDDGRRVKEQANRCECCGRSDWVDTWYPLSEALERGWIEPT